LILAHAARGFCAWHTVEGIESLRGLENVYFDTSVVCEPGAMQAILRVFGASRLMYGSDWPVCNGRGRCVSIGDGFYWVHEYNTNFDDWPHGAPTLIGIESLLALQEAAIFCDLTDADIQQIFAGNARDLLSVD
jgi:glutamate-1-semialdehyde 2,1-aminomutase